jgi:hypothetical protein
MKTEKILERLILITIALTPLFSIGEIIALFLGTVVNNSTNITPVYIKLIKDLLFAIIILVSLFQFRVIKKVHLSFLFLFPLLIFIVASLAISPKIVLLMLAGMRWILCVILMFFLIGKVQPQTYFKISKILYRLFIAHFIIQVIQFLIMPGYFGVTIFGRSSRNPGIFFIPNTAAFFSLLCLFFALYFPVSEKAKKRCLYLVPISIFLTASGTGIAGFFVVYGIYLLKPKYLKLAFVAAPMFAIPFLYLIEIISGRDIIKNSLVIRIDIFLDLFKTIPLVSNFFGAGTTSSFLASNLTGADNKLFSTDSTFATIIVNLGLLPFLLFFVSYISWIIMVIHNYKNKELLIFTVIFTFFALTTSFTESFPGNFLFAVLFSGYIKKYLLKPSNTLKGATNKELS